MGTSSGISPTEPYSYWYRRPAYLARTTPDSSEIQHYDPVSQTWKVEDRLMYIKWLSEDRVKVPEDFANKIIAQWTANRCKNK